MVAIYLLTNILCYREASIAGRLLLELLFSDRVTGGGFGCLVYRKAFKVWLVLVDIVGREITIAKGRIKIEGIRTNCMWLCFGLSFGLCRRGSLLSIVGLIYRVDEELMAVLPISFSILLHLTK